MLLNAGYNEENGEKKYRTGIKQLIEEEATAGWISARIVPKNKQGKPIMPKIRVGW
jgi:hypothetical protein